MIIVVQLPLEAVSATSLHLELLMFVTLHVDGCGCVCNKFIHRIPNTVVSCGSLWKVYSLDFDGCDNIDGYACLCHNFVHRTLMMEAPLVVLAASATSLLIEPLMSAIVVMTVSLFVTRLCNCRTFDYCDTSDGSDCLCHTSMHITFEACDTTEGGFGCFCHKLINKTFEVLLASLLAFRPTK